MGKNRGNGKDGKSKGNGMNGETQRKWMVDRSKCDEMRDILHTDRKWYTQKCLGKVNLISRRTNFLTCIY